MATLDQRQYLSDFYKIASIKMACGRRNSDIFHKLHLEMCFPYECNLNGRFIKTTKGKMFYLRKLDKAQSLFDMINSKPPLAV